MIAILTTAIVLQAPQAGEPPSLWERAVVETALEQSPLTADAHRDPWMLLRLLRLERTMGVPGPWRGMTLAVSYRESVWVRGAAGDEGRAVGWMQLQRWHWRWCNHVDRTSPVGSARCWLARLHHTFERKERRRCRGTDSGGWLSAWRWVARGNPRPPCEPRQFLHLAQLKCWRDGTTEYAWVGGRRVLACRGDGRGWQGRVQEMVARTGTKGAHGG